jgi:hypothetical protein
MFLTGIVAAGLAIPARASVPGQHYTPSVRELPVQLNMESSSLEEIRRHMLSPTLDPHPFSEEFYLREFAGETPVESRRQHSKLAPLTNAASGLSKMVASWRRALARMMP